MIFHKIANSVKRGIVATYDGSNPKLYVNGVLKATQASTRTYTATGIPLRIGGSYSETSELFYGQIDDVRIFNYALTPTQVKMLYNNEAVNFAPATGTP